MKDWQLINFSKRNSLLSVTFNPCDGRSARLRLPRQCLLCLGLTKFLIKLALLNWSFFQVKLYPI